VGQDSSEGINETNALAVDFYKRILELREDLQKYLYWQRAWTFQEWAVADEIEVTCDSEDGSTVHERLEKVKSIIVFTAIMMAD
jgi:hypothetical protein